MNTLCCTNKMRFNPIIIFYYQCNKEVDNISESWQKCQTYPLLIFSWNFGKTYLKHMKHYLIDLQRKKSGIHVLGFSIKAINIDFLLTHNLFADSELNYVDIRFNCNNVVKSFTNTRSISVVHLYIQGVYSKQPY